MSKSSPLIIHFHVPRTGGTTVGRMLKLRLGFHPPTAILHQQQALGFFRVEGWENRVHRIQRLSSRAQRRVRLFEAHAGFGLHELLPSPSMYITMLREPIDRAVSAYSQIHRKGLVDPNVTLEQFLDRPEALRVWWLDNAFVRYYAGERGNIVDVPTGSVTQTMFEVAMERLNDRIDFFGITERFDDSMVLLRRVLNWPHCYYVRSRANRARQSTDAVAQATLDRLRDLNQFDMQLYTFAYEHFESRIAALGEAFQEERRAFDKGNARYARRAARIDALIKWRRRKVGLQAGGAGE